MSLEEKRIKAKFRPVDRELNSIKKKTHKTEGWLFVTHVYTIDELLNSEHHEKINSYTDKIGDDITRWYDQGKLSREEEGIYYSERDKVEIDLEDINDKIKSREPLWWEKVKGAMQGYIIIIMDNMPDEFKRRVIESLMESFSKLGLTGSLKKLGWKG